MTLSGSGWQNVYFGASASGAGNSLKMKFTGNRVDLVLLENSGIAKVFIDGKAPSQLNLFHGPGRCPGTSTCRCRRCPGAISAGRTCGRSGGNWFSPI